MKTYLLVLLAFLSIQAFGQKPKKNTFDTYNYDFPKTYLPAGYDSYSAILKLDGQKKVYVDGEYVRESRPMRYNEFWKEEDIFARLAAFQFLKYEIDPTVKKEDKLIVLVEIGNARIDATIDEKKGKEYPFTYKFKWSVDVTTTLTNSLTGEEVFKNVYTSGGSFRPSLDKDEKKISSFKTYKEAKEYVPKIADKGLVGNKFYKETQIANPYRYQFDVLCFRNTGLPFYTIANEKKYPKVSGINKTINETIVKLDELAKEHKGVPGLPAGAVVKSLLRKEGASGFKVSDDFVGLEYRKKLIFLLKDIETESEKLIPQLNASDKKEKNMLWAMYINKATVRMYTGKFDEALANVEKAKALKYKKKYTESLESIINSRAATYDFIAKGKTKDGREMNPKYGYYLYN